MLEYQLQKHLSLKELGNIYRILLELKEKFIDISFVDLDVNELEQVRFYLLEQISMIKIYIREKVGQDFKVEFENLKQIYKRGLCRFS